MGSQQNIFDLIDSLSLKELCGNFYEFINQKIDSGEIKDFEKIIIELQCKFKSFISYQLGSVTISHGIGCGYYDPDGKEDKKIIQSKINDYLFDICFNPHINKSNYEHFIDFVLVTHTDLPIKHTYLIEKLKQVLLPEQLRKYWAENGSLIKKLNFENRNKVVRNGYYISYNEHLNNIYNILDQYLEPEPATSLSHEEENIVHEVK